jgi:SAM-dependent methyltransferase
MYIAKRGLRLMRNAVASYGPSFIKKALWDREYSAGDWYFNDNTAGDCVYSYLEKYAKKGSILDIGCGSGNTANELSSDAYSSYLGVDISDAALDKARAWSEKTGRAEKNTFLQADFLEYVPSQKFDAILFRESMYLIPMGQVKATLDRYSQYLKDGGVFVVRICTMEKGKKKSRPIAMVETMETGFDVIEKRQHQMSDSEPTILVFRPQASAVLKEEKPS